MDSLTLVQILLTLLGYLLLFIAILEKVFHTISAPVEHQLQWDKIQAQVRRKPDRTLS